MPNEEEAKKLNDLFDEYFCGTDSAALIPPWAPTWKTLHGGELERFRKARRTLVRLNKLDADAWNHPEIMSMQKRQRLWLFLRPNPEESRDHFNKLNQLMKLEKKRLLNALKAEGDETVDHTLD